MKKIKNIVSIICLSLIFVIGMQQFVVVQAAKNTGTLERPPHQQQATEALDDPLQNPDIYDPSLGPQESSEFVKVANMILGIVRAIGTILSVIMAIMLGIKYLMGSVDEKADFKKTMIPYIVGIVLLFAGSQIVGIIQSLVSAF